MQNSPITQFKASKLDRILTFSFKKCALYSLEFHSNFSYFLMTVKFFMKVKSGSLQRNTL